MMRCVRPSVVPESMFFFPNIAWIIQLWLYNVTSPLMSFTFVTSLFSLGSFLIFLVHGSPEFTSMASCWGLFIHFLVLWFLACQSCGFCMLGIPDIPAIEFKKKNVDL